MRPLNRLTATAPSEVARLSVIAVAGDCADVLRVTLHGELDISNATWFAAMFADMTDRLPRRPVLIDLADLRFLDAAGIRALLLCVQYVTRQREQAVLSDPQPIVHRLLEITGLLHLLAPPNPDDRQVAAGERTG
jgi:anti-sigma B factor antagonist